jgi:hypothetical protein
LIIKGDISVENRKLVTPAFRPVDDTDVTTWALPEGASPVWDEAM